MKKTKLLVLVLVALTLLAGCGNKSTNVSDSKEVIFTIGKNNYTKGDFYSDLKVSDAAYSVITMATEYIANAEFETTEDINLDAMDRLNAYKQQLGDSFEETIKSYGYKDEADLFNSIITTVKTEMMSEKYFTEKKDDLYKQYSPVLARLLYVEVGNGTLEEAKAKAEEAYNMIKSGATFDDAAEKYATNVSNCAEQIYTREDSIDLNVIEYLTTVSAPGVSNAFVDKNSKGYYVVQVTATNPEQVEEQFITYLSKLDDFSSAVNNYFFQKHGFTIYDVDVYNDVKTSYPSYLPASK